MPEWVQLEMPVRADSHIRASSDLLTVTTEKENSLSWKAFYFLNDWQLKLIWKFQLGIEIKTTLPLLFVQHKNQTKDTKSQMS